jgi:Zn-dependent protease with chaperone function
MNTLKVIILIAFLSGGTIMGLFRTHPPLEKRIEPLMKMEHGSF